MEAGTERRKAETGTMRISSASLTALDRYFGFKATSGLCQPLIAPMPPHAVYIETHLGGGAIMRRAATGTTMGKPTTRRCCACCAGCPARSWSRVIPLLLI